MKARGCIAVFACAVVALLALSGGAAAKTKRVVHPGSFLLEIELPKSNGWTMNLTAVDHRQIYLSAQRGAMTVTHRVAGRASSRLLKADLGPFGRIDIQMNLEAHPLYPSFLREILDKPNCRGKEPVELTGPFHGLVDFGGEGTVGGASVRKGRVTVARTFRSVCERRAKKPSRGDGKDRELGLELHLLAARAHGGGRTTALEAIGIGIESEIILGVVSGSVHERLGRVRIIRSAAELVEGPELTFSPMGQKTATAKLKPPEPFAGRASFLKRAGSPATWTGDLSVRLPGAGEVPLAGPEFNARLCRGSGIEALDALRECLLSVQTLADPGSAAAQLRGLYGSGSHSQPLALARLSSLR